LCASYFVYSPYGKTRNAKDQKQVIGSSPIPGTSFRVQRKLSSAALAKEDIHQLLVEDGSMIRRFSLGPRKAAA
jgi:hypothetical protein